MEVWENVILIVSIILFIVFMSYFLVAWKQLCCSGALSNKNLRILTAAANRQGQQRRTSPHRSEFRRDGNATTMFGNMETNSGIDTVLPPPPSFEEALKCPRTIYFIEVEDDPPSYLNIFPPPKRVNPS